MDLRSLFSEKAVSGEDEIIVSNNDLVEYMIIQPADTQSHETIIRNWFGEFFSHPQMVLAYHLFPFYYYRTRKEWDKRDADPYIEQLILACDCLYHLYENHPGWPDEISALMTRFSLVVRDSVKRTNPADLEGLIHDICDAGSVMPEQPSRLFMEHGKAVLQPPPLKFYTVVYRELFVGLWEGFLPDLPEDPESLSDERKKDLLEEVGQSIVVRGPLDAQTVVWHDELTSYLNQLALEMKISPLANDSIQNFAEQNSNKENAKADKFVVDKNLPEHSKGFLGINWLK